MEDEQKTCSVFIGKIILDSQDDQLIWVPLLFPGLGNGNNSKLTFWKWPRGETKTKVHLWPVF